MATTNLVAITDPFLQSVLDTSAAARETTLRLLQAQIEAGDNDSTSTSADDKLLRARLARLRGMTRRLALLLRQAKLDTAASRAEVDSLHLGLQNLYYESRHLAGEIDACGAYAHKYTGLDMEGEDEYLAQYGHPEPEPGSDGGGEDALMRARIAHERQQRAALEAQRQELAAQKLALVRENAKRKEELGKLDRDLEAFIEAAQPIQQTFERELGQDGQA